VTSRLLDAAQVSKAQTWQLPEVNGLYVAGEALGAGLDLATAKRIREIEQQAHAQGYALGRREGHEQGLRAGRLAARTEAAPMIARLRALFDALAKPIDALDAELERDVVDLAILIARHLVRRELKTRPGEIVGVVREAIAQLPSAARSPRIRLNPDDAELVRSALSLEDAGVPWRIDADPLMTRGGCMVETTTSFVDATVEGRLAAIVARALGGERAEDRGV
jgi:flagellar assembly protein FliH